MPDLKIFGLHISLTLILIQFLHSYFMTRLAILKILIEKWLFPVLNKVSSQPFWLTCCTSWFFHKYQFFQVIQMLFPLYSLLTLLMLFLIFFQSLISWCCGSKSWFYVLWNWAPFQGLWHGIKLAHQESLHPESSETGPGFDFVRVGLVKVVG